MNHLPVGATLLIAHPDDELLFFWPFLQVSGCVKYIVCMVSDEDNPERSWCKERASCLGDVAGRCGGIQVINLRQNSEFYRLPTRGGELKKLMADAVVLVGRSEGPIITHNPHGEYGNLDHILCHQAVRKNIGPHWMTDISLEANWLPIAKDSITRFYTPAYDSSNIWPTSHTLNLEWFNGLKKIYDDAGCWTWSKPVVERCLVGIC